MAQAKPPKTAPPPFELVLEVVGPSGVRASLKNRSSSKQIFLRSPELQPLELVLTGPSGRVMNPQDRRRVQKFDRTLYRELYEELAVGAEEVLEDAAFEPGELEKGVYGLTWGPFEFQVKPGTYRLQAVFRSRHDAWVDDGKRGRFKAIWKGVIKSNVVEVTVGGQLPPPRR